MEVWNHLVDIFGGGDISCTSFYAVVSNAFVAPRDLLGYHRAACVFARLPPLEHEAPALRRTS